MWSYPLQKILHKQYVIFRSHRRRSTVSVSTFNILTPIYSPPSESARHASMSVRRLAWCKAQVQIHPRRMIEWRDLTAGSLFLTLQKEQFPCLKSMVHTFYLHLTAKESYAPNGAAVPSKWARRGWPGAPGSGCSCRCGGRRAGKPGRFWTWSSSPCQWGRAPRWRQGWHWKSCSSAGLADRRNTGRCKQKPSLLWSGCVARSTQTPQEKIKSAGGQRRREHVMRACLSLIKKKHYCSSLFDQTLLIAVINYTIATVTCQFRTQYSEKRHQTYDKVRQRVQGNIAPFHPTYQILSSFERHLRK